MSTKRLKSNTLSGMINLISIVRQRWQTMKNTKNHTRWICLNLILMILLSGMCYESVKADSLLQRLHTGAIESQQTAHQLNDVFFGGPQNEGTEEVFGVRDFESCLVAVRKTSRISCIRTILFACFLLIVTAFAAGWIKRIVRISALPPCNQQTIIRYIHRKDGAKG